MPKDSERIDLSNGYELVSGSNHSVLSFYNRMIKTAQRNIGKTTINGIIITEKFIQLLQERRYEIADRVINMEKFKEIREKEEEYA
jgi:hypothetical protein